MRFYVDLSLDLWLTRVEIEAESLEAAKEELARKVVEDPQELIEEAIIKSVDYSADDWTVVERHVTVSIKNIVYDVSEEDAEDNNMTAEEISRSLPSGAILEFDLDSEDDLEELIEEAISEKIGWLVKSYNYEIIKER